MALRQNENPIKAGSTISAVAGDAIRDIRRSRSMQPMEQPSTHLRIKRAEGVTVIEFADRKILEELSIQEIGDELNEIVESEPGIKILLNFKNVDHLSSAALGMLITLNKKVTKEQNGALKLSDINRQIFEVFKITRLNKVFDIHDTADQALAGFNA
jgi:anti-sigma B factor antagonist